MKIQKEQLFKKLEYIFFLFLVGSVIGWLYEVVLHLVSSRTFVNRGILHGPWLPIYGTGCVLMAVIKRQIGNKPAKYFIICVVASGVLEYTTSWLMETIYHKRWWDYSNFPLNLQGRIFVGGLVGFAVAGWLFAYLVLPVLERKYRVIPPYIRKGFTAIMVAIFIFDVLVSLIDPNTGIGITRG